MSKDAWYHLMDYPEYVMEAVRQAILLPLCFVPSDPKLPPLGTIPVREASSSLPKIFGILALPLDVVYRCFQFKRALL